MNSLIITHLPIQTDSFFILVCDKNLWKGSSFKQVRHNFILVSNGSRNSLSLGSASTHLQPHVLYMLTKFK